MNIFSKLFKPANNQNNQNINPNPEGNCIIFSLDPKSNDEPFIKIRIENTSNEDSIKFAQLLCDITDGLYSDSIVNLMLKMTDQNLEIKQFVHSTIMNWSFLIKSYNESNKDLLSKIDNQPVIMPTDFNKNAK